MLEIIITSSLLILIIIALRFLLRGRLSQTTIYALWLIAAVRLLIPVSIADTHISVMNLFERRESVQQQETVPIDPYTDADTYFNYTESQQAIQNNQQNIMQPPQTQNMMSDTEPNTKIYAEDILAIIWAAGSAAVLIYIVVSNVKFYRCLKNNRIPFEYEESTLPVYIAEGIDSPCLFGVVRPAIYLNEFAAEDEQRVKYIVVHEQMHCRHFDHIWAVVRVLCVSFYWFNPLVWLAAHLSRQDCELACDSAAIREIGSEHRYEYGRTLIDMISTRFQFSSSMLTSTAMTSGAKSIKRRIEMLRITPQNIIWAVVITVVILAVAVGCTFTGAAHEAEIVSPTDVSNEATQEEFPDLLAEYATFYNPANMARSHNIVQSANYIDGTVIQPGEEFSFNETVGERTPERGFLKATVYSSEANDEDYGGGVAQTAAALFNAAFMADLEITQHFNHLYTVPYLTDSNGNPSFGNDASISWDMHDLCFVNNMEYPVEIRMTCDGDSVAAAIYGTDDGSFIQSQMAFTETESTDYKVVFRPIENGKFDIVGQIGRTINVYRVVMNNGVEISREKEYTVTYLPQNQVIYTNDLPEGYEYHTEYQSRDVFDYPVQSLDYPGYDNGTGGEASKNSLDGMTMDEVWKFSEVEYLIKDAPMFEDAVLTYAAHHKKGVIVTEAGAYNMYGLVPELNMLILVVRSTNSQRAEYIEQLHDAGFIYTADDGSGNVADMCVFYNAPKYGVGVQLDGPGEAGGDEEIIYNIVFFEQRDGCYGYKDPVPKG